MHNGNFTTSVEYINALNKILLSTEASDFAKFLPDIDFLKNDLPKLLPVSADNANAVTMPKEDFEGLVDSISNLILKSSDADAKIVTSYSGGVKDKAKQAFEILRSDTPVLRKMKADFQAMLFEQLGYSNIEQSDKVAGKVANALEKGTLGIRSYDRKTLYNGNSKVGDFPISASGAFNVKHFTEWMFGIKPTNEKEIRLGDWQNTLNRLSINNNDPGGVSFSILPSRIFNSDANRIGFGVVLPSENHITLINKYTSEGFLKENPECIKLSKDISKLMTTITYFDNKDLFTRYDSDSAETVPFMTFGSKDYYKYKANNYLERIRTFSRTNEAVIKLRYTSAGAIGFFHLEDDPITTRENIKDSIKKGDDVNYRKYLSERLSYLIEQETSSKSNDYENQVKAAKDIKTELEALGKEDWNLRKKLSGIETKIDSHVNRFFPFNTEGRKEVDNFPIRYEKKVISSFFHDYKKNVRFGNIYSDENLIRQDVSILDSEGNPIKFQMTRNDNGYKKIDSQMFSVPTIRKSKAVEIKDDLVDFFNLKDATVNVGENGMVKISVSGKDIEFDAKDYDNKMVSWYKKENFENTLKDFNDNLDLFLSKSARHLLANDSEKYFSAVAKLTPQDQAVLKSKMPDFINGLDYEISGENIVKLCDKFNIPTTKLADRNIESYIKKRFDNKVLNELRENKSYIIHDNINNKKNNHETVYKTLKADFLKVAKQSSKNIIKTEFRLLLINVNSDEEINNVLTPKVRKELSSLANEGFENKVKLSNDNFDNIYIVLNKFKSTSAAETKEVESFNEKYKKWVCEPKVTSYSTGSRGKICATNIGKRKLQYSNELNELMNSKPSDLPENKNALKRFDRKARRFNKNIDRVSQLLALSNIGKSVSDGDYGSAASQVGAAAIFNALPIAQQNLKNLKYQRYLGKAGLGLSVLGVGTQVYGLTQSETPTEAALLGTELGLNGLNIVLSALRVKSSFFIPLQVVLLGVQLGIDVYRLNDEIEKMSESYDMSTEEKRDEFWKRMFGMYSDTKLKRDLMHSLIQKQHYNSATLEGKEDYFLSTFPVKGKIKYLQDLNQQDKIRQITPAPDRIESEVRLVKPTEEQFLSQLKNDQFYTDKYVRAAKEVVDKMPNEDVSKLIKELEKISNSRRERIKNKNEIAEKKDFWEDLCNKSSKANVGDFVSCTLSAYYQNADHKARTEDITKTPQEKQSIADLYAKIPSKYKDIIFSYMAFSNTGFTAGRDKFPPASLATNPIDDVKLNNDKKQVGTEKNPLVCSLFMNHNNQNAQQIPMQSCEMSIYEQSYNIDQRKILGSEQSNIYGATLYSTNNLINSQSPKKTLAFNMTSNANLDFTRSELSEVKGSFDSKKFGLKLGEGTNGTLFQMNPNSDVSTDCKAKGTELVIDVSHARNPNTIDFTKYKNKDCDFHIVGKVTDNVNWNIKNDENNPIHLLTENTSASKISIEGKTNEKQFIRAGTAEIKTTNPNSILLFDSVSKINSDHIYYIPPEAELYFSKDFNLNKISGIEATLKDNLIYYKISFGTKSLTISSQPNYRLNFGMEDSKFISITKDYDLLNNKKATIKQFSVVGEFDMQNAGEFEVENIKTDVGKIRIAKNKAISPSEIIHFNDAQDLQDVKTIDYKGDLKDNSIIVPIGKNVNLSRINEGREVNLKIVRFASESPTNEMMYFKYIDKENKGLTIFATPKTPANLEKLKFVNKTLIDAKDLSVVKSAAEASVKIASSKGKLILNENGKFYDISFDTENNLSPFSSTLNTELSTFKINSVSLKDTKRMLINVYDLITSQKDRIVFPFEFKDIIAFADNNNNLILQAGENSVLISDFNVLSSRNIKMEFVDSKNNTFEAYVKDSNFVLEGKKNFKTNFLSGGATKLKSEIKGIFKVKLSDHTIHNAILNENFKDQNFVFTVNEIDMKSPTLHILNRAIDQDLVLLLPKNIIKFNSIRATGYNGKKDIIIKVELLNDIGEVTAKTIHIRDALKPDSQLSGIMLDGSIIKLPDLSGDVSSLNDDLAVLVDKIEITDTISSESEEQKGKIVLHRKVNESPLYSGLKYASAGAGVGAIAGAGIALGASVFHNHRKEWQMPKEQEESETEEQSRAYKPVIMEVNEEEEDIKEKDNTLRNTVLGAGAGAIIGAGAGFAYGYYNPSTSKKIRTNNFKVEKDRTETTFSNYKNSSESIIFKPAELDRGEYGDYNETEYGDYNETEYEIPNEEQRFYPEPIKNSAASFHSKNPFSYIKNTVVAGTVIASCTKAVNTFIPTSKAKVNAVIPEFDDYTTNQGSRNLKTAKDFVAKLNNQVRTTDNATFLLNDGEVIKTSTITTNGAKAVEYKISTNGATYKETVDDKSKCFESEITFPSPVSDKNITYNEFTEYNETATTLTEIDSKKFKTPGGLILNPSINCDEVKYNLLVENAYSLRDGVVSGLLSSLPDIFVKDESMLKIGISACLKLLIQGYNIGITTFSGEMIRTISLAFEKNLLAEKTKHIKNFDNLSKEQQQNIIKLIKVTPEYKKELEELQYKAKIAGLVLSYGFSVFDIGKEVLWNGNYFTAADKTLKLGSNYVGSKAGSLIVKTGINVCSKEGILGRYIHKLVGEENVKTIKGFGSTVYEGLSSITSVKQDLPEPTNRVSVKDINSDKDSNAQYLDCSNVMPTTSTATSSDTGYREFLRNRNNASRHYPDPKNL